jgi:hypothetical protein
VGTKLIGPKKKKKESARVNTMCLFFFLPLSIFLSFPGWGKYIFKIGEKKRGFSIAPMAM